MDHRVLQFLQEDPELGYLLLGLQPLPEDEAEFAPVTRWVMKRVR